MSPEDELGTLRQILRKVKQINQAIKILEKTLKKSQRMSCRSLGRSNRPFKPIKILKKEFMKS
eukprot:1156924-Pelagomonas_calceolata.AAC.17